MSVVTEIPTCEDAHGGPTSVPMDSAATARHGVRVVFRAATPARMQRKRLLVGAAGAVGVAAIALIALWRPPATAQPRDVPIVAPPAPTGTAPAPTPKPRPKVKEQTKLALAPQRLPLPEEVRFRVTRRTLSDAAPPLAAGYAAYVRGDAPGARSAYEQTLSTEPENRQALMGLAALAVRRGETAIARGYYQRLLESDPEDMVALSGMLSLESVEDNGKRQARLQSLLMRHPRVAALHRLLADSYARDGRWSEARLAYAEALALSRRSAQERGSAPDLAFDLAVSLEHLGRLREAMAYYRQALDESQQHPGGFDPAVVEARLAALSGI